MKTKMIKNNPLLPLLLVLALVFSMVAVVLPAKPTNAASTAVILQSPTSDNSTNTAYVKAGGNVAVTYTLVGAGGDANAVQIQITNGTTTIGTASVSRASNATYTESVLISAAAAAGSYNVIVADGNGNTASSNNAVVVDNTAPSVSLALPGASSCWKSPSSQTVQWAASDAASADNVTIFAYMSTDSGATYPNAIQAGVSYQQGAQIYTYTVPGAINSSTCKVSLYALDRAGNWSDNATSSLFSILSTAPVPTVTAPNGGDVWNGASNQTITGTIAGTGTTVYYMLELQVGGVPTENITASWQAATLTGGVYSLSYPWTVSNNVRSSACIIRLMAKDCAGNTGTDLSNANFRIKDVTAPTVTVTRPTTGQAWYAGTTENITWTQTDNVPGNLASVQLYYTIDGGGNWFLIGNGTVTQGSNFYSWSIPGALNSTNCKIKIVATDAETPGNVTTAYSGTFTISSDTTPPTITVCTPNGGESWQVGSLQSITWTSADTPDATARLRYLIQLSTDSGATYPTTIADLSNQTQCSSCGCSYSWAVSDNASPTAMIRITATDPAGLSASDSSNAVFTITAATCGVETASITLSTGWNLISLPINPTNTDINSILSGVMPSVVSVWYYTGGASGTWYSYAPGAPSTLTAMNSDKAYWINMAAGGPYTLTFQGRKCPCPPASPTTFTVSTTGWNMLGFKSTINKTVQIYFGSLGTCGTAYLAPINGWNGATQAWTTVNCADNMTPGSGNWVYVNTTGMINPGCD